MASLALYLLLSIISLASADPTGTRCPPVPGRTETCVCQTPQGIIDLTSLSNTNGTPRFGNLTDANDYAYFYNPCKTFDLKECKNVHACQAFMFDPEDSYEIASNGTEQMWIDKDGTPYAFYTGPDRREVYVHLKCDPSATTPVATTTGDEELPLSYEIYITSCQVCPGGCRPPNPFPSLPILCPPIPGEPSCMCQHPNGIIDLRPFANVNGTARFSVDDGQGNTYYYNPCQSFHRRKCWNTHICVESSNTTSLAIADSGTEKIFISSDSGQVYVQYNGPYEVLSRVYLECDPLLGQDQSAKMVVGARTAQSDTCPLISVLTIKSCQVCPGGCQ